MARVPASAMAGRSRSRSPRCSEIFGYCLTTDTSQQKAFLIVGPKRSGKGTIGRVLHEARRAAQLRRADARLARHEFRTRAADRQARSPSYPTRDCQRQGRPASHRRAAPVDHRRRRANHRSQIRTQPWTGRLPTRFLILSNELFRLADASGALASRFILLC